MANEDQSTEKHEEGPGGKPVGWRGVIPGAIILVGFSVLCLYSLVALWPHPTPSGSVSQPGAAATTPAAKPCVDKKSPELEECQCLQRVREKREQYKNEHETEKLTLKDDPTCVYIFSQWWLIWNETRLILIVMLSGFLGALVYSLRSFFWYAGNRELKWSWLLMYLLVPLVGAMLAVIFYMLLRGGLFSPSTTVADTSPFGFAAIAALVGMFINQASEKLRSVFETLMTKAATGRDAGTVQPPTLQSINPSPIPPGIDSTLTIKGAGFTQASVVFANGEKLTATFGSANELSALFPAKMATGGSTISFIVSTPDAGKSSEVKVNVSAPTSPP